MENEKTKLSTMFLAAAVGMSLIEDKFELLKIAVQKMLVEKESLAVVVCLDELLRSKEKDRNVSQFLDKYKQEFNALTKVVLNELEKELRLEEKEDE